MVRYLKAFLGSSDKPEDRTWFAGWISTCSPLISALSCDRVLVRIAACRKQVRSLMLSSFRAASSGSSSSTKRCVSTGFASVRRFSSCAAPLSLKMLS